VRALHRPGEPLLRHAQGGRAGRQGSAHPGRPGARPARDRAHPGLLPEARGRSERAFGTLQDRLPKELALAGITTVAAANRFLREVDLPEHNARFAIAPEHPETAFVADRAGAHRDLLCVQEERVVGNDNCVRYRGLALQIPPSPLRRHFVKLRVRVHDDPDGTLAVFHGPRCLARYRADGGPLDHVQPMAA
jgi:hypothetical protein